MFTNFVSNHVFVDFVFDQMKVLAYLVCRIGCSSVLDDLNETQHTEKLVDGLLKLSAMP